MFPDAASAHAHHRRRRSDIALRRLAAGIEPAQIAADFIAWGVDPDEARLVVEDALCRQRSEELRLKVQPVWIGGSMLLVGILLTVVGLQRSDLAAGGMHRYLVMGLLILPAAAAYALFGLTQILVAHRQQQNHANMATRRIPAEADTLPDIHRLAA